MKNHHIRYFLRQTKNYNAHPVILTQYRRKAYMSYFDDYARVTFDRSLRRTDETNYNVLPDDSKMLGYGDPETFDYSGGNIVVEIKCERKIPMWIVDFIKRFNLQRISFSKYSNAMLSLHSTVRESEFSRERIPFNHPPFE